MQRKPAHIAMFTVPAAGHIHPGLEIMRELVARGHRVTYAVTEEFAAAVEAVGAESVLYHTTMPSEERGEKYPEEDISAVTIFLDEAVHVLPQMTAAYEDDRPDLVLYDIGGWAGLVLAGRWGLPAVQISPTFVAWKGYEELMAPVVEARMQDPRGVEYYARFSSWLAENGVESPPDRFVALPERAVVTIPKALQPHAELVDESVYTFVGPCLGDRSHQGDWRRPAGAAKVLLISLGSAYTNEPQFYRACFEAFGGLDGWHVVLNVGRHVAPDSLGPSPGNFDVRPWVPQLAILRQADAFLTHAGMGGTMEALACGVPMVAVPQAVDQFTNAEAIAGLGVGRHVPKQEATAAVLREAVLSLSEPAVARRSRELREELRAAGGAPRAVSVIGSYLP
ncbi:glycosyltransferase [Streptomyces sp. ACA25]|uniref:macrolide family glycosyltransferase n=1 Tax=Streptomyces sp. ACA25 TaxID=3022596 RepID=UPI0023071005|nr:macrolide family glycosyltransferase [Streptomyces sp. ACA25]MDB1090298.1 glycosyltransferase [Streptomyces sp. ACA25]